MRFKIVYGNHGHSGINVADVMLLLQYGLESIGHTADIVRDICPGEINIVQENFTDEYVEQVEALANKGTQFIVIATEYLIDGSFNKFDVTLDKSYYSDRDHWLHRFKNFLAVEKRSIAVWHLCSEAVESYRKYLGHDRVFYLPHHYLEAVNRVVHRPDKEKDIDFLFTGAMTDYRKGLLSELESKGYKVEYSNYYTAPFHRENLLARTKIALNIRQYAQWPHPSPSRYYYHIMNDSLMITETCDYQADIQKYVLTAPRNELVEYCESVLAERYFTKRARHNRGLFANELPMAKSMIPLVSALRPEEVTA